MSEVAPVRTIWCDEAGSNGPDMLHEAEPVFVYASHDLVHCEAEAIAAAMRAGRNLQSPELKAKTMRRRPDWIAIALELTRALEGRAIVIATDKQLNLAGRVISYLIKPALAGCEEIFEVHDVFRIGMRLVDRDLRADAVLSRQINELFRRFDLSAAPSVFAGDQSAARPAILRAVLAIARAHRIEIDAAIARYRGDVDPAGVWSIDLALPSLYSILFNGWGDRFPRLEVICDESKPLRAFSSRFDEWIDREHPVEVKAGRKRGTLRGCLAGPLRFENSKAHVELQIADLLAGVVFDLQRGAMEGPSADRAELEAWMQKHMHPEALLPYDGFRRSTHPSRVAAAVLRELGARASAGRKLTENLEALFDAQRRRYASPAARVGNPGRRRDRAARCRA